MGCCNDKILNHMNKNNQMIVSEEEDAIKEQEKMIPFTTQKISSIEKSLKKYESEGIFSMALLKNALTRLDFEEDVFTDPDSAVFKFLMQLQNEQKLYQLDTILLSAILLGSGSIHEKANTLFNLYDKHSTSTLETADINCMIRDILKLSVKKFPMIAIDDNDEPAKNTFKSDRINKHINSL